MYKRTSTNKVVRLKCESSFGIGVFRSRLNIYKITSDGQTKIVETGLTAILGLVFDDRDRMYVLETTTGKRNGNEYTTPGTGKV